MVEIRKLIQSEMDRHRVKLASLTTEASAAHRMKSEDMMKLALVRIAGKRTGEMEAHKQKKERLEERLRKAAQA